MGCLDLLSDMRQNSSLSQKVTRRKPFDLSLVCQIDKHIADAFICEHELNDIGPSEFAVLICHFAPGGVPPLDLLLSLFLRKEQACLGWGIGLERDLRKGDNRFDREKAIEKHS